MTGNGYLFEKNLAHMLRAALPQASPAGRERLVSAVLAQLEKQQPEPAPAPLWWSRLCDEERQLAAGLVSRDHRAWQVFCRDYCGPLHRTISLQFACAEAVVGDIVHQTFSHCLKSIEAFDPERGSLFDWLKALSHNLACILAGEVPHREGLQLHPLELQSIADIDVVELPAQLLNRGGVKLLILDTLMDLSGHYRQVLVIKHIENQPVAKMASRLGQPRGVVESLLTRSHLAFREHLHQRLAEVSWHPRRPARVCAGFFAASTASRGDSLLNGRKHDLAGDFCREVREICP